jgi:hypothetical protein
MCQCIYCKASRAIKQNALISKIWCMSPRKDITPPRSLFDDFFLGNNKDVIYPLLKEENSKD